MKGKDWKQLERVPPIKKREKMFKEFLESTKPWLLVDAIGCSWIGSVIAWVISKKLNSYVNLSANWATASTTVIDTLARICKSGVDIERIKGETKMWATLLVRKIASAVGASILEEVKDWTYEKIRYVFTVLMQRLSVLVRKSLEQLV